MSERSTFSPFWHRVRTMRPRLRPHVQITRQHYRGRRWHVVHDPSSNAFFRLSPVGHEFVGLIDGKRTVEDVWQVGLTRHGDEALTQNEVIQLLSQLYSGNLLAADTSPETEQLLGRGRERVGKKAAQQAIGLMYFKVRLFNPDAILSWIEPIFRPVLGKIGFIFWVLWVVAAVASVIPHWDRLVKGVDSAIAPSNWAWMIVVFVVLKLWHELGHGIICKRFGGQVPEFGAMMLVLMPAPFVDATSAWTFASKWHRMAVGAGGMIFELAAAGLSAFVWLNTSPGELLHQIAYNAMFTASISTVLFNANPLMRFDGYYILSDFLEVPNLQQRSFGMLKFLCQKNIYRVKNPVPPTSSPSEALWLIAYGILALAYRIFLFISITLYLVGSLFAIGVFLAVWSAAVWFIMPMGQFIHYLATNSALSEFRGRAILTSLLLFAAGIALIGALPMPDYRRADGVIESEGQKGIFFKVDSFVKEIHARPGEIVKAGDVIAICESDQLQAQFALVHAQLEEAYARERQAKTQNEAAAQIAAKFIESLEAQLAFIINQKDKLIIRAPRDGTIVGTDFDSMIGKYVQEGTPLGMVVNLDAMRAVATLSQREAWIYELPPEEYKVEVRRASDVASVIPARFEKTSESGDRELPHPALGFGGGGTVEIDAKDQSGTVAKTPLFKAYFIATDSQGDEVLSKFATIGSTGALPGERVYFRFTLPSKPWLVQWIDRLDKQLQGKAQI